MVSWTCCWSWNFNGVLKKEKENMPHKVGKKWKWANIERDTKQELVKVVYGIWVKNGKKGSFSDFWKHGKSK